MQNNVIKNFFKVKNHALVNRTIAGHCSHQLRQTNSKSKHHSAEFISPFVTPSTATFNTFKCFVHQNTYLGTFPITFSRKFSTTSSGRASIGNFSTSNFLAMSKKFNKNQRVPIKASKDIYDTPYFSNIHLIKRRYSSSSSSHKDKRALGNKQENAIISNLKEKMPLVPGIGLSVSVMYAGLLLGQQLGLGLAYLQNSSIVTPISGIPCAILLGILLNNTLSLSSIFKPGLTFCTKPVLQLGIICVGFKLSSVDLVSAGLVILPAVGAAVASGLMFIPWFGRKMGLSSRLSSLIAVGTSICGVTAISALAPAIKANEQETSFAIANVVAFGTFGMLAYPYVAHTLLDSSQQIGMALGLAVHDTSQVMGCAMTYDAMYHDELVLKIAAVTKLSRNLCLAAVIPGMTWYTLMKAKIEHSSSLSSPVKTTSPSPSVSPSPLLSSSLSSPSSISSSSSPQSSSASPTSTLTSTSSSSSNVQEIQELRLLPTFAEINKYVPGFVYGFVGMTLVRSLGDVSLLSSGEAFGFISEQDWKQTASLIGTSFSSTFLGVAMASVGLSTETSKLKGVGFTPFFVGLAGAGVVGGTGLTATMLLGNAFNF